MKIEEVQFPLYLPTHPQKRAIKVFMGRVLAAVQPTLMRQVRAGDLPARLGFQHRLLIAALVDECEKSGRQADLTPLQNWLWRSEQSVAFHSQAEARFQSWWMECDSAITIPMRALLTAQPGRFHTLCEIGCGSGLVLADLAMRFPQINALIGLDLSPTQTALNASKFPDPQGRLRFAAGDATEWLPAHAKPGWIIFTNAGVLEYFSPAALSALLRQLAAMGDMAFALAEPIADDFDWQTATESRPFSAERTFSHPYPHLFRAAGWEVQFVEERRPSSRHLLMVATALKGGVA